MLFLAVTLGFFVENQREHYIEYQREKEYAKSLYDDLKIDTATAQRTTREKIWIIAKYDSALNMLSAENITNVGFIYYAAKYTGFNDVFTSQDVTFQQLKNSGNFRYFGDLSLYKELADYYNLYSRYQSLEGDLGFQNENMTVLEASLFNAAQYSAMNNDNPGNYYDIIHRPEGKNYEPVVQNKQSLKELYFKIANAKNKAASSKLFLSWLTLKANEIIKTLKKKYHLN